MQHRPDVAFHANEPDAGLLCVKLSVKLASVSKVCKMVVAAKSMLDESREIASSIEVFIFGGRKLI